VGELDAFAVIYALRTMGLTLDEAERMLCKESGLKGLSGGDNDIRDIVARSAHGEAPAKLALEVYAHNVRHWLGSYFLQLNGLDALVFTAGIGENQAGLREAICRELNHLGLALDPKLNAETKGREAVISAPESAVKIMVIPTNEELVVAREVRRFLQNN
jgi:acetate kinase